jgi:hypothetical protein
MSRIAGITTKKNVHGKITHVTFNVKKHYQTLTPLLEQLGIQKKSAFMQEFEKGLTIEECRTHTINHIRKIWKK